MHRSTDEVINDPNEPSEDEPSAEVANAWFSQTSETEAGQAGKGSKAKPKPSSKRDFPKETWGAYPRGALPKGGGKGGAYVSPKGAKGAQPAAYLRRHIRPRYTEETRDRWSFPTPAAQTKGGGAKKGGGAQTSISVEELQRLFPNMLDVHIHLCSEQKNSFRDEPHVYVVWVADSFGLGKHDNPAYMTCTGRNGEHMLRFSQHPDMQWVLLQLCMACDQVEWYHTIKFVCTGAKHRSVGCSNMCCEVLRHFFPQCQFTVHDPYVDKYYSQRCQCPEFCWNVGEHNRQWLADQAAMAIGLCIENMARLMRVAIDDERY